MSGDIPASSALQVALWQRQDVPDSTSESDLFHRFFSTLAQTAHCDPRLVLKLISDAPLPKYCKIEQRIHILKNVVLSAQQELEKIPKDRDSMLRMKDPDEALERLFAREQTLTHRITKSHKNIEKLTESLEKLKEDAHNDLLKFYQLCFEMLFKSSDEAEEVSQDFFEAFKRIHQANEKSILPFIPLITFLSSQFQLESLKHVLEDAKECNPFLTYAIIIHYISMTESFGDRILSPPYEDKTLELVKKLYPEDLLLPAILKARQEKGQRMTLNLDVVDQGFNEALNAVLENDDLTSNALEKLVTLKPFLVGTSHIDRYIALLRAFMGDIQGAQEAFARSKKLIYMCRGKSLMHSSYIFQIFLQTYAWIKLVTLKSHPRYKHDPLEKFIKLAQSGCPLDVDKAKAFISTSVEALRMDRSLECLPFILFGVIWLKKHLNVATEDPTKPFGPLMEPLSKLLSVSLHARQCCGEFDPWMSKTFTRNEDNDGNFSYTILFDKISFSSDLPPPIVRIEFAQLELTLDAQRSVTDDLVRHLYDIFLGMFTAHLTSEIIADCPEMGLPDDSLHFTTILCEGCQESKGTWHQQPTLFKQAICYLDLYYTEMPRRYPISEHILNWARLTLFATGYTHPISESLKTLIHQEHYPTSFNENTFQTECSNFRTFLKQLHRDHPVTSCELSLRDAKIACEWIDARSQKTNSEAFLLPSNLDTCFTVFKFFMLHWGWEFDEAFEDWGVRLKAEIDHGLFSPRCKGAPFIFHEDGQVAFNVLKELAIFWLEFHQKTTEKNAFIAGGGDEDTGHTRYHDWHSKLEDDAWKRIIKNNTPERYPQFSSLSDQKQKELKEIIQQKHDHTQDVEKLKEICKKKVSMSLKQHAASMAAGLLSTAECDRKKAFHSVFLADELGARYTYQILLEVAAQRLIRRSLIINGPDHYRIHEAAGELFCQALSPIIGAFHGPEKHESGGAPYQDHYNAGIYALSEANLENTHIFYQNRQYQNRQGGEDRKVILS